MFGWGCDIATEPHSPGYRVIYMSSIETVKIVSKLTESGFVRINKSDFVDGEHEIFNKPEPKKKAARKKKAVEAVIDDANTTSD